MFKRAMHDSSKYNQIGWIYNDIIINLCEIKGDFFSFTAEAHKHTNTHTLEHGKQVSPYMGILDSTSNT